MSRIKFNLNYFYVVCCLLFHLFTYAQSDKSSPLTSEDTANDNIYMTWNATTPETEMKDDIKALADKGITIKYSNVKRNSKDEITAIKVEYKDRKGNSGNMELNNQKPINTIKFYKQGDEVGFGEPSNAYGMLAGNDFFSGGGQNFMKQFNFGNGGPDAQSFDFTFPDGENFGKSNSKVIIKKDGKKPLVIENGEVIEGGDDYTKEEIEEIKKNNKVEHFGFGSNLGENSFDLRNGADMENFKKQMEKMQMDVEKMTPNHNDKEAREDFDKTKGEMLKAKEEMLKAKEELEKAKKELDKAKSGMKTRKA